MDRDFCKDLEDYVLNYSYACDGEATTTHRFSDRKYTSMKMIDMLRKNIEYCERSITANNLIGLTRRIDELDKKLNRLEKRFNNNG